jgi:hypothetical protein
MQFDRLLLPGSRHRPGETVSNVLLGTAEERGDEEAGSSYMQEQGKEVPSRIVSTNRFQKLPVSVTVGDHAFLRSMELTGFADLLRAVPRRRGIRVQAAFAPPSNQPGCIPRQALGDRTELV